MAIVKSIEGGIKCAEHITNALDYVTNPKKAKYVSLANCAGDNNMELSKQFYQTRQMHNQEKGILAHHFVQSFSPDDNVTPETAHQIAKELIKKIAPDYQVVIATHVDVDHIHNHFIINSCNLSSGHKYNDNKKTLRYMQKINDELCRKNNLSVIKEKSKFRGIDQTTYQLAKKGKSWKVNLVKDLDKLLETCKTKEEFLSYLNENNYSVKIGKKITIQKNGEAKAIRLDTLAKQFGDKYSQNNVCKICNIKVDTSVSSNAQAHPSENKKKEPWTNEFERKEYEYFKNKPEPFKDINFEKFKASSPLQLIKYIFTACKNKRVKSFSKKNFKQNKKYTAKPTTAKNLYKRIGNISVRDLKKYDCETTVIKITASQAFKLLNAQFFYSCGIDLMLGTASVALRVKDLKKLSHQLGFPENYFVDIYETRKNKYNYGKLKEEAKKKGEVLESIPITKDELEIMKSSSFLYAVYNKRLFCSKSDKEKIEILLHKKTKQPERDSEWKKNNRINKELKSYSAVHGDKLCYRIINSGTLEALKDSGVKFAYFKKEDDKYNIVFLDSDRNKINRITEIKKLK
ncbi:MAG: relaxase/mobilization nuclease domain-containing protein [Acutalibacteraceae bacterium]